MGWIIINSVIAFALVFTILLNLKQGQDLKAAGRLLLEGIFRSRNLVLIMFCLGALIGVWNLGGTIPSMILAGSSLVQGRFFLALGFIVATIFSLLIGTFIGTLGTIGVALMGVGQSLGVEPALVAGVLVSGAIIGDRMSPLSSGANLVAEVTGTKLFDNLAFLLPTMLVTFGIALLYYLYRGLSFTMLGINSQVAVAAPQLGITYSLSLPALLPLLLIIFFAALRRSILTNLFITLAGSIVLAAILHPVSAEQMFKALFFGTELSIASEAKSAILHGGGLLPMLPLTVLIILVNMLGVFWEAGGIFERLTQLLSARINGTYFTSVVTMLLSALIGALFFNQTLAIIIPGRALGSYYEARGLPRKLLALDIADSGVVLAAVIPWHVMAMVAAKTLGVSAADYLPYAVVPWLLPVVSIVCRKVLSRFFGYSNSNNFKVRKGS